MLYNFQHFVDKHQFFIIANLIRRYIAQRYLKAIRSNKDLILDIMVFYIPLTENLAKKKRRFPYFSKALRFDVEVISSYSVATPSRRTRFIMTTDLTLKCRDIADISGFHVAFRGTRLPASINFNYILYKMWDEITYPSPNFHGCCTVEVWEWLSNFNQHFTGHVNTYPCWALSQSTLVNGPLMLYVLWRDHRELLL